MTIGDDVQGTPSQLVDRCPHCFQRTAQDVLRTYVYDELEDPPESHYGLVKFWRLLRCVSCERPILQDVGWWELEPEDPQIFILHPSATERSLVGLPDAVRRAYDACLKVRAVDANAFAVLVGRLLEVIAVEEGIRKGRLVDQLKQLADTGRIPPTLAEMADQLRLIRNLGAHAQAGDVSQGEVPVIADFAEAIVEYLYRAPAKIDAVRARLEKQKADD